MSDHGAEKVLSQLDDNSGLEEKLLSQKVEVPGDPQELRRFLENLIARGLTHPYSSPASRVQATALYWPISRGISNEATAPLHREIQALQSRIDRLLEERRTDGP